MSAAIFSLDKKNPEAKYTSERHGLDIKNRTDKIQYKFILFVSTMS